MLSQGYYFKDVISRLDVISRFGDTIRIGDITRFSDITRFCDIKRFDVTMISQCLIISKFV